MILIVDDNRENIFSLKKILELSNFEVDSALSGEEALKKIIKKTYALIILDVQMPGMDGFEVAEAISGYSKAKNTSIIFLSAVSIDKKFITKGYSSGGVDYITKPVDPDILLLKVKTFYRLYEQTSELNEIHVRLRDEIEVRKKAQAELKDRVRELRSILESIPQIAFTATSNGHIEFVNQHWFQYAPSENEFPETHPDDTNLNLHWAQAIKQHQPFAEEVRIRKINKSEYRWHLLNCLPIHENQKLVKWVGTFTDIDEQKKVEQRKDEFLSIASHELKTPLTSIKGYMQLLERMTGNADSNTVQKYVGKANQQIEKLEQLVSDLLDVSKIESGRLLFNKKTFEFNGLLQNALETIRQTNYNFQIHVKGNASVTIYADEVRIEQVLINLLNNAIKYSPDSTEVEVETEIVPDKTLTVKVKDYGVGIPKEKQQHLFKKFYRVESAQHFFQGLGIGLYICAEIIKRHNGTYGVESMPGKGSIFYFSIPLNHAN